MFTGFRLETVVLGVVELLFAFSLDFLLLVAWVGT